MADTKISALTAATPVDADYLAGVDVSDTTQSPGGSTARFLLSAIATYVIAKVTASAPATLDTLNELATALGNDPNFAATMTAALAAKAPLASPALTGNPTAPTQAAGTNNTRIASTAFVMAALATAGAPAVASGAPTAAPAAPGLFHVDTNAYDLYFSTGNATVSDWRKIVDNTDGAAINSKAVPVLADAVFGFDSANGDAPVVSTWTQIIAALALVTLDGSGRLANPKSVYTSFNAGSKASGTYTPAASDGNIQHCTNDGAFTLAPPATLGSFMIEIVNGASAGAITTSGFTKVGGDALTTTAGHKFIGTIRRSNSVSELNIRAMQ